MNEEQIRQNAKEYIENKFPTNHLSERNKEYNAFIAGAHSRDEEVEELRKHDTLENKMRIDLINECEQLKQELDSLRNPWISAKDHLPDYPESEYDINNMYLVCRKGGSVVFPAIFRRNGKWYIYDNMQAAEIIAPDYWMPMSKLIKGE